MNKLTIYTAALLLTGTILLAGCSADSTDSPADSDRQMQQEHREDTAGQTDSAEDAETMDDAIDIDGDTIEAGSAELSGNTVKITKGGTYTISGSGKMVVVDAKGEDVTLVLDDVTLNNDNGPGIYVKKAESLSLEFRGDNAISCGDTFEYEDLNAAVYSKADLSIQGEDTLRLSTGYGHGIKAKDSAVFNGNLTIDALQDGIHVNDVATFTGGTYRIKAASEGIESKDVLAIQDGTYDIQSADDCLNAGSSLDISGGTLDLVSQTNDAVDSNGSLTVSGGTIHALALQTPETAFDVDNTSFVISGGTIVAAGSMGTYPTEASQPLLMAEAAGIGNVRVEKAGKTILEGNLSSDGVSRGSVVLFLSSPEMKAGDTVTVFVNGESLGEVTLEEGTSTLGTVSSMDGPGGMKGMQPGNPGDMGERQPGMMGEQPPEIPGNRNGGPEAG